MSEASDLQTASVAHQTRKKSWFGRVRPLFWGVVVLPTVISAVYFGAMASDRYTSESSFIVRSPSGQAALSGVGAVLQNVGFSRSQDDTYTLQEYLKSRTALGELSKKMPVRKFYEEQGDIISRFNGLGFEDSNEAFYQYYRDKVGIRFDPVTGVTVLSVASFDAGQSQQMNAQLLKQGEALINQLNTRARRDTLQYAEDAVAKAEERVRQAADGITAYRIEHGVLDLKAQADMQMGLVSKLQDELILIQTQLDQVRSVTPENPQIVGLQAREKSLRGEIAQQMKAIAGSGKQSFATQTAEYQRLVLENELSEKQLAAAVTALENVRSEVEQKQLYLEVVEQPSRPDLSLEPRRVYNIIATLVMGLVLYGIISLLIAGVREHKN